MRVLIAEDDLIPRRLLEHVLTEWGYEVTLACDGMEAWQMLQSEIAPPLAILDWVMPGMSGDEVCRRLRLLEKHQPTYIIFLTSRGAKADIVAGLQCGANDYITKPFNREELQARIAVGRNVIMLQQALVERVRELEVALAQVKQLHALLPICSYCHKVRDDQNYWDQVESYLIKHSEVRFSHCICPDCWTKVVQPQMQEFNRSLENEEANDPITNRPSRGPRIAKMDRS